MTEEKSGAATLVSTSILPNKAPFSRIFCFIDQHFNKQNVSETNSRFRKLLNKIDMQISQNQLCKKFDDDHKGPINVLIHLTTTQHKRMAQNCIHVTKKYRKENKVYYSNMVFGDNICKRRQKACVMGNTVVWSEILMNNIKNGVVYITTAVDELSEEIQNGTIYLIDGTSTCTTGSGVVILMMCKLGEKDNCTGKE